MIFKKYRWVFMLILFAITLSFGIVLFIDPNQIGQIITCFFSGALICGFGIFRLIPLLRSLKGKKARLVINAIEITCDIIIGALLFGFAFNEGLRNKLIDLYKYLIALVLYARGVIYFVETTFLKGEAEPTKFIVHIICITMGSILVVLDGFNVDFLTTFFASLLIVLCAYCAADAIYHYVQYRKLYCKPKPAKVKEIKEKKDDNKEDNVIEAKEKEEDKLENKPEEVKVSKKKPEAIEETVVTEVKETKKKDK